MRAVSVAVIGTVFAAAALLAFMLDFVKVPVFRRLEII
jgi:hypothetical protein